MKKNYSVLLSFFVAICFTISLKLVDVGMIGPNESSVGYSHINEWFFGIVGTSNLFDKLSDLMLIVAILGIGYYAFIGFLKFLKTKKMNRRIFLLGVCYVISLIIYLFFEKVIINYRPILVEGVLEASYPSSHTFLVLVVGITSMFYQHYQNKKYSKLVNVITGILMGCAIVFRLLSGYHWLTDIVGAILFALFIGFLYQRLADK